MGRGTTGIRTRKRRYRNLSRDIGRSGTVWQGTSSECFVGTCSGPAAWIAQREEMGYPLMKDSVTKD